MSDPIVLADRFVLGDLLGSGAMGDVYEAYDRREARRVAVKRLRPAAARHQSAVHRFAREGAILRTTAHPNIVAVLAVIDDPSGPCIVMEHVGGGTLEQLLAREGRLPIDRVLSTALDLSDALARAHRLGVVHRDVKPGNVLLADDGTPRLSDFGIASIADAPSLTAADVVIGTLPYVAPEGWDGEDPTPRTDVWSLGVMLYEMVAGRRPFTASHPGLLLAAITVSDPPPLASLRPDVPPALADAIAAMLQKDPQRRMASPRELGVVVERLIREPGPAVAVPVIGNGAHPHQHVPLGSSTLPRPTTPFIGRETQLAEIRSALRDPHVRLLTLTGAGGTGKTRLAIAAAESLAAEFADGIVFVDLAPITDPTLVIGAIAHALEAEEELDRPLVDIVADRLGDSHTLVVLDNFEQVVSAASEVARLVAMTPNATFLVTSRFRLRVAAERDYPVPGLEVNPVRRAGEPAGDAVALFVQRARSLDPRFTLDESSAAAVGEICRRLDGLPLAIELAAARSRVLPPTALLARLGDSLGLLTGGSADVPARQRTLRQTIEWSVRLLDDRDRALVEQLAMFVGGWSLEDAEAVAGDASSRYEFTELVDGLQSLLEKSLVTVRDVNGEPRYGMLETIRELARELLAASGYEPALAARHARHFAERARSWSRQIATSRQADALAHFAAEHDNMRAALAWADAHDPALLVRLAGSLGAFWYHAGHWTEALGWNRRALARESSGSPADRALVLDHLGRLEMFLGDERSAMRDHEAALALAEAAGEPRLHARAAEGLGEVLLKVGDVRRATALLEESERIARQSGDAAAITATLTTLATAYVGAGAMDRASTMLEEALGLARAEGDRFALTKIHYYLAGLALLRDDARTSRIHCDEGRIAATESGDAAWVCHLDEMLARALVAEQRFDEAAELITHSLSAFRAVGSRSCLPHSFEAVARMRLATSRDAERATRFLGVADQICRSLSITMLPVERALFEQTTTRARAALGEAAFESAWRDGAALSEDVAVAEAT
jgi:non-specific serine/threonine protein kinase